MRQPCPRAPAAPTTERDLLLQLLAVLRPNWTPQIIIALLDGPLRYTVLRYALGTITATALIARLRTLEAHGLVSRIRYPEVAPGVEYTLTEAGRRLGPVLEAMAAWGAW